MSNFQYLKGTDNYEDYLDIEDEDKLGVLTDLDLGDNDLYVDGTARIKEITSNALYAKDISSNTIYADEYLNLPDFINYWKKETSSRELSYDDGSVRIGTGDNIFVVSDDNNTFIIKELIPQGPYVRTYTITLTNATYNGTNVALFVTSLIRNTTLHSANSINVSYLIDEKKFVFAFPDENYLISDVDISNSALSLLRFSAGDHLAQYGTVQSGTYFLKSNISRSTLLTVNGPLRASSYPDCISQVTRDLDECFPVFLVEPIVGIFEGGEAYLNNLKSKYQGKFTQTPLASNFVWEIVKYTDARFKQLQSEGFIITLLTTMLSLLYDKYLSSQASNKFNDIIKRKMGTDPAYRDLIRTAGGIDYDLARTRDAIAALGTSLAALMGANAAATAGLAGASTMEEIADALATVLDGLGIDDLFDNLFGGDDNPRIDCRFNMTGWNCTKKAEIDAGDIVVNNIEEFLEGIPLFGDLIDFFDDLFDIFGNNDGPKMITTTNKIFTEGSPDKCVGINCYPIFSLDAYSQDNPLVARFISKAAESSILIKSNSVGPHPSQWKNNGMMLTNYDDTGACKIDVTNLLLINNQGDNSSRLAVNAEVVVEQKAFTSPTLSITGTDCLGAFLGSSNENVCGLYLHNIYNGVDVVKRPSVSIDMKAGNFFQKAYSSMWTGLSKGERVRYGSGNDATMRYEALPNIPTLYLEADTKPIDQNDINPYKYLRNNDFAFAYPVWSPTFTLQKRTIGINNASPDPQYALHVAGKVRCFQLVADYINVPQDGLEFTYGDPKLTVGFDASGNINMNGDIYKNRFLEVTVDISASIPPSGYLKCKIIQDTDLINYIVIDDTSDFTKFTVTKDLNVFLYNSNEEDVNVKGFYLQELTYDVSGNITITYDLTSEIVDNYKTDNPSMLYLRTGKTYVLRTINTSWLSTVIFPSIFIEYRELYIKDATTTTSGIVQLDDQFPITSSSITKAPTVNALRRVYDLANSKVTSQWTPSGSNIFYTSGNVGIGTANPSSKLHVNNKIHIEGSYATKVKRNHATISMLDKNFGIGCGQYLGTDDNLYLYTFNAPNKDIVFSQTSDGDTDISANNWTHNMIIKGGSGYVGIGTTTPTYKLDVSGSLNVTSIYENGVSLASRYAPLGTTSSQWTTSGSNIFYTSGNVGIGITNPSSKLHVNNRIHVQGSYNTKVKSNHATISMLDKNFGIGCGQYLGTNDNLYIYTFNAANKDIVFSQTLDGDTDVSTNNWTHNMIIKGGTGSVGIGKTNPSFKLDVSGSLNATSIYENGTLLSTRYAPISTVSSQFTTYNTSQYSSIYYNNGTLVVGKTTAAPLTGTQNIPWVIGRYPKLDVAGHIQTAASNNILYVNSVNINETTCVQLGVQSNDFTNISTFARLIALHKNSKKTDIKLSSFDPQLTSQVDVGYVLNEKNFLYCDHANSRVGILTSSPLAAFDVNGNTIINGTVAPNQGVVFGAKTLKRIGFRTYYYGGNWSFTRGFYNKTIFFNLGEILGYESNIIVNIPTTKYIVTVVTAQGDSPSAFFNVTYSVTKRNTDFDIVICTTDNLNFTISGSTAYNLNQTPIQCDIKVEEYA